MYFFRYLQQLIKNKIKAYSRYFAEFQDFNVKGADENIINKNTLEQSNNVISHRKQ